MVRIFAREFEIDIALLVQPLMRTIAQGNRIKCETIAHDRSSRSHAAGPNVFACIGIETQGVINRNIVPHGFFGQLIAARWQASVTIVWPVLRFLVNHSLHQRAGNVCEPVHREPSAQARWEGRSYCRTKEATTRLSQRHAGPINPVAAATLVALAPAVET
jgi:hypothetical protein